MGCHTHFTGKLVFKDQKQLTRFQWLYLRLFQVYCHCQVRQDLAEHANDPVRTAAGLPLGPNCCFFLDSGVLMELCAQQPCALSPALQGTCSLKLLLLQAREGPREDFGARVLSEQAAPGTSL